MASAYDPRRCLLTTQFDADILYGDMEGLRSVPEVDGARQGGRSQSRMAFEIGSTVEGTVVKLADYGAIVRLAGGKTGLIHISEVADTFVRDVKDYFKEHDRVRVKILSMNSKGRYELSTKQVEQPPREPALPREQRRPVERVPEPINLGPDNTEEKRRSFNLRRAVQQVHEGQRRSPARPEAQHRGKTRQAETLIESSPSDGRVPPGSRRRGHARGRCRSGQRSGTRAEHPHEV